MHDVAKLFERQCGVFTLAQAVDRGSSRSAIRWAVRKGELTTLRRGVFGPVDLGHLNLFEQERWRHAMPAVAAVLTTPGAQASHSTAAVLRELPLAFVPATPCVTVVPWHTGEVHQTHVHRTTDEPRIRMSVGNLVELTSAARTCIDLAREHGVHGGLVPMDFALRYGLTTVEQLEETLRHCRGWPGVRTAREAVALADPRSESAEETLSRLRLVRSSLPDPRPQRRIGDLDGRFIARVDFYWDEVGVVGEVDGALKYDDDDPASLHEEKRRQDRLEDAGLMVTRWGAAERRGFDEVEARLRRSFRRGSARRPEDRRWTLLPDDPLPPPRALTPWWS